MNFKYLKEKNKQLAVFEKLDFRNDIDDWVAIAAACDGIISVSTADSFCGCCPVKKLQ